MTTAALRASVRYANGDALSHAPPPTGLWDRPGLQETPEHRYYAGERELVGVTTLIGRYGEPFDAEGQSLKTALKEEAVARKTTQRALREVWSEREWILAAQAVRDRWAFENNQRSLLHDQAHALALDPTATPDGLPWSRALNAWWLVRRPTPLAVEQHLWSAEHGLAGRCDLIADLDGAVTLVDYKSSGTVWLGRTRAMAQPIDDMVDNAHSRHSLQLSAYRLLAGTYTDAPRITAQIVVHLWRDGRYREYHHPFLEATILALVADAATTHTEAP